MLKRRKQYRYLWMTILGLGCISLISELISLYKMNFRGGNEKIFNFLIIGIPLAVWLSRSFAKKSFILTAKKYVYFDSVLYVIF